MRDSMFENYGNILAVLRLGITIILIVSEKLHRTVAAMIGAILVVALGVLPPDEFLTLDGPIHWEALGLIFGMFIMVTVLMDCGFFKWVGQHVLMLAGFKILRIFLLFCAASAFLAAFMDCVTVLMFMAALTLEIARILHISPIPFIIAEITSANIGGSSTMVGDPPNIIIGTALDLNFVDFVVNIAPITIIVFFVNLGFFYVFYNKLLTDTKINTKEFIRAYKYFKPPPEAAIKRATTMYTVLVVFIFTLCLLVFSHYLHISVALIGIGGAVLTMVFGGKDLPNTIDHIDWKTLILFACLFIIVGGLEHQGVTQTIANGVGGASGGNLILMVTLVLWLGAFLSWFVDNVPVTAMMVPMIKSLAAANDAPLGILAWSTCLGCGIGASATPIGGSDNLVALSVGEKGGTHIKWKDYMKVAIPATLLCLLVINGLLVLRILILGH